ncbi:cyclic lactone autoinducer peptide [Clostridium swellfunianum]|nr:cyclic lactone autoinducer peptide [Clostridium swellfunianum]MCM0647524.1 cyclic lactone autoinducer peptide [Clostridium swellfunianum]
MRKLMKSLRAKNVACTLCLGVSAFLLPFYGSFLFLGEPEIPECLIED